MSELAAAVEKYRTVLSEHRTLQELQEGTAVFHRAIPAASESARNAALRQLVPVLETAPLVPVSAAARTCGALVEFGADPAICGAAILGRLPQMLRGAAGFLRAVLERAEVQEHEQPDYNQLINLHINDILDSNPEMAWAYIARESLALGAITHLSRSKALRAEARARPELLALARATDAITQTTSFLTDLLRVLDDERLVVLHPGQQRGFEARISGIADNGQLQTLLADALVGDPGSGWLAGVRPEPAVAAAARDGKLEPDSRLTATGAFHFWNWPALRGDGTIPEGQRDPAWWIWNEGSPGDVMPFEGVRVILVGSPPYPRSWNAGRRFTGMIGECAVERALSPEEVRDWLARLAAAPRPEPRPTGPAI